MTTNESTTEELALALEITAPHIKGTGRLVIKSRERPLLAVLIENSAKRLRELELKCGN